MPLFEIFHMQGLQVKVPACYPWKALSLERQGQAPCTASQYSDHGEISKLGLTAESLLDPTINIATGVKILNMEFEKHGKNWNAVGYYHSPNSHRGLNYSWRIYQLYHDQTRPGEIPGLQERIYAEQKGSNQNISDRTGIWRNPNSGQARGLKSFQVRGQGIIRLSGAESGASASQAGTVQD